MTDYVFKSNYVSPRNFPRTCNVCLKDETEVEFAPSNRSYCKECSKKKKKKWYEDRKRGKG